MCPAFPPPTKRLRHKRFPPHKWVPLQLFRFLLVFAVVHSGCQLSFFPFFLLKKYFGKGGRDRKKGKTNKMV